MTLSSGGQTIAKRRLYLCTADRADLEEFISGCIDGGVDVVQLRDKNLDARALIDRAQIVRDVCRAAGVPFILNDRPDLALEVGADGVHVGQDDAPPRLARRILGDSSIVGVSTHRLDEFERALKEPVDYLSAGPVVPTLTKPGRPGTGTGYIREAAAKAKEYAEASGQSLPFFITGGVTPETVPGLVEAGARHFVVVRYLTESKNPTRSARVLRDVIDGALKDCPEIGPH